MSRTAAPRGEVIRPIALRQHRQRLLALRIEQALGLQALLQLLESELQRAQTHRLDVFHVNLIFAARLVHADRAAHGDVQAILGPKFHPHELIAEAHASNLRASVLQREVEMARLRGVRIGHFAFDGNIGELPGQQIANARGEVADRPDPALGHQRKLKRASFAEQGEQPAAPMLAPRSAKYR